MVDYTKTTGNEKLDAFLGCGAFAALAAFFIWLFFFNEPSAEDLRRREEVQRQIDRQREIDEVRKENARIACNAGVASACVEYRELID